MNAARPWTDEEIATIQRLWNEGMSAAVIAKSLPGHTRNSVIGKLHRLDGYKRRAPQPRIRLSSTVPGKIVPRKPPRVRVRSKGKSKPPTIPKAPLPRLNIPADGLALFLHRKFGECVAPYWAFGTSWAKEDVTLAKVCGRPVSASGVYCSAHAGLFYLPPKERDRRAGAAT